MTKDTDNSKPPIQSSTEDFEQALLKKELQDERYILRLFVAGMTPNSQRAIDNVQKICEAHLQGRYDLEIIDIYQQPSYAKQNQIVAAPTLIKELPLPLRKFIGDLSKTEQILAGLEIIKKPHQPTE
ncbi:MAG: circadian clock KaiB family protein [Methylococcales bacterium]|nr:circadian clock KaiB family protein [Methylococcales bacterium]